MKVNSTVATLLARTGIASVLGMQMGGARDMYQVFGWKTKPTHVDFKIKYKRQAVARRVVNAFPDALWADPPIVQGDKAFDAAWQDLLANAPVFATLQKLDKLCRLGRFAVMVVGLDDGRNLETEVSSLRTVNTSRKVIYLQPYSEGSVDVSEYETNFASPRYGLPKMYTISPGSFDDDLPTRTVSGAAISQRTFKVHWTRVLHVAEGALESPVYGASALEAIYNDLDDLEKVSGGSSETFWLNARQGIHVDVDKEMDLKPGDADALEEEIDEYSNQLRRVIRTRGVKVKSLGSDIADPRGTYDIILSNIASSTGIPKRVLSGSEAGQLASQQDRANWSQRVEERISEYGSPVVLLPFLRTLINAGVLPKPSEMIVTWPDAFKMNPLERAQTSAQMARSAANLSKTLKTIADINHANAVDSLPTVQPVGGGGLFGNQQLLTYAGDQTKTDPNKNDPADPKDPKASKEPQTVTTPALYDKKPPTLVLLTEEECRQIIGFGKHMPVFDSKQDSTQAVGTSDGM